MKYKIGQIVYYVDEFVFSIARVKIYDTHFEYYVDKSGAFLIEYDLFPTLESAKTEAFIRLEQFYINKRLDIKGSIDD
jgi:hypothetical protein